MPDNFTNALIKAAQSPALARVSNQLALTDKLLTKPEEPFLIPYRKGNKWGFCDRNKNIVIDCIYDDARAFFNGLAAVRIDSRSLDAQKRGIRAKHQINESYPEDRMGIDMNGWGFINLKGDFVIPCIYSCVWEYSEGLAAVSKGTWLWTDYNLVDIYGKIYPNLTIRTSYYDRLMILDGLACVNVSNSLGSVKYYNGYGKEVDKQFTDVRQFSEGLVAVSENHKWGFVNKKGNIVIPLQYASVGDFSEGLSCVGLNGSGNKFYIDSRGEIVLKHSFHHSYSFHDGLAKVIQYWYWDHPKRSDVCGYINKQGELTIPFKFQDADHFSEGLARVLNEQGLWGFINKKGEEVIPCRYKSYVEFKEFENWHGDASESEIGNCVGSSYHLKYSLNFKRGLARVVLDNKEIYIDKNGKEYWEK